MGVFLQIDELVIERLAQRPLHLWLLQDMRCFSRSLQGRIEKIRKAGMVHRRTEELRDPRRAKQGFIGRNRLRVAMKVGTVYGHGKYLATRGHNDVELVIAAKTGHARGTH